jgi:hypothetical protein
VSRETPQAPWAAELRDILDAVGRASEALREMNQWMWKHVVASDVLPRQMPEVPGSRLGVLERELGTIRRSVTRAFERYSSEPSRKLLTRKPLTREEYFVGRAMGLEQLGQTNLDDYEAYRRSLAPHGRLGFSSQATQSAFAIDALRPGNRRSGNYKRRKSR